MDARTIVDNLDLALVAIAPDWTIAEWNPAAARLLGRPADQVLGRNFWFVAPAAQGTHLERALHEVLLDGEPRVFLSPALTAEPGGPVVETRVTRGPGNHLIIVFRRMRETADPASHEGQLVAAARRERQLYVQLFSALPIPALLLSADGRILEANAAACGLFHASDAGSIRGRPLSEWTPAGQRAALATAVRDAAVKRQRFPLTLQLGDGASGHEVDALLENVEPAGGTPKLLFVAADVPREVLLQRRLLQADRLSQLGGLVSGVAHELNNPLAAIAAFAEVLRADADTPELKESAGIIHTEAMRAGRVVQTLLDFARQRPRTRQAVDMKDVVERVIALHRSALRKARVQATVDIDDSIPAVLGDPQELQQVCLNVLANAEQAIASTGRPGKVRFSARRADNRVVLLVEDTGPGIPAAVISHVFEPFFTTKGEAGTGLGLAISYGLVKANGGRMYIHNLEGGGARLGIELEMEDSAPPSRKDDHPAPAATAGALSILIVDDEESVRRGLTRMAERLGHRVASARNHAEARQRLEDDSADFDVLLLDVHLDEANSGFDLLENLRAEGRGRERRVIFTTGDSLSAGTRDQLEASARPLLKKPFNLAELRDVLERVGEGARGKEEG